MELWDGLRTVVQTRPDDVTTFRDAWSEIPPVLCRLEREVVTLDIDGQPLRTLSPGQTRQIMNRQVLRNPEFLEPALRIVLAKLKMTQQINPAFKAMIVTGNDQPNDPTDNRHAAMIRDHLARLSPEILGRPVETKIITLKTLEDQSAATAITTFFDSTQDVVIVKQMGTVGLDDSRLKVLGYFSPIRSVARRHSGVDASRHPA